jgi:hypothetical protein
MLVYLNKDILNYIIKNFLSIIDIIILNKVCKTLNKICIDYKQKHLLYYKDLLDLQNRDLKYRRIIRNACKLRDHKMIEYIVNEEYFINYNKGMVYAIKEKNQTMLDYFINIGACDWDLGIKTSIKLHDQNLTNYFLTKDNINYYKTVQYAAEQDDEDLINIILNNSKCLSTNYFYNVWDEILFGSSKNNRKKLISNCIEKSNSLYINMNNGLYGASESGNITLLKFFIDKGAYDFNVGMCFAARRGQKNIVKFLIKKGANCWNLALGYAARGGYKNLINYFIKKGAYDWNWGLYGSAQRGDIELINFFISKGADDWNSGLFGSIIRADKYLIRYFISKGAYQYKNAITYVRDYKHEKLFNILKDYFIKQNI